jgi:hypothetical protein
VNKVKRLHSIAHLMRQQRQKQQHVQRELVGAQLLALPQGLLQPFARTR